MLTENIYNVLILRFRIGLTNGASTSSLIESRVFGVPGMLALRARLVPQVFARSRSNLSSSYSYEIFTDYIYVPFRNNTCRPTTFLGQLF